MWNKFLKSAEIPFAIFSPLYCNKKAKIPLSKLTKIIKEANIHRILKSDELELIFSYALSTDVPSK